MGSKLIKKYFDYSLLEGKKNIANSLLEDEIDDMSGDIGSKSVKAGKGAETKEPKKESPGTEYKVNTKLNIGKDTKLSYGTYVTLFVEALNSLDAMASLANSVDPNYGPAKDYKNERYKIALMDESGPSGLKSAWDKLITIAGQPNNGLSGVVQATVLKNDAVKGYQEEKKKLDDQKAGKDGKQITDEYYNTELIKLKEKYNSLIDPTQIMSLSKTAKALAYYKSAILKFKQGADIELSFVEKSADSDEFYEKVSDAISNIILSKKPDEKKLESYTFDSDEKHVIENLGGFLNANKAFVTGVGQGIKNVVKGGAKDEPIETGSDQASILYAAEGLKGSLMSAASEIDNVINFKKNVTGTETGKDAKADGAAFSTAQEAKSGASEMIKFIQDSFKYVVGIKNELSSSTTKSIGSKLDAIAKQLSIYRRKGGPLDQWKNDVLGESRERVASTAYLQKGRELMAMGSAISGEISKYNQIQKDVSSKDADKVIKRAVDAFKGVSTDSKPSRIKSRDDVKTFDPKNPDKEVVKSFQQRLIDLGHLPAGTPNGEYDESTKNASKIAMTYVGNLAGKVYQDSDEAFKDFQKDLGVYADKKVDIRKDLGF